MRKFSVIDCETDPFRHGRIPEPFVWGMYDERGFQTFRKTAELVEFMQKEDRIFYAHNGGKFDFHYLLNWVNTQQEMTVIHGRVAKCGLGKAELRDSYCIFPDKLDTVISGKKESIDYTLMEVEFRDANWSKIIHYLEADVYHLWHKIAEWRETHGNVLTLAGAAMNYWAKHFNDGIKPKMGTREAQERYYANWSNWYFGGRVECFEPGIHTGPIHTFDINSAYPAAMMLQHPAGPHAWASKESGPGFERKLFKIDAPAQGYFAVRKKTGGIYFPTDGNIYTFNVTGWELKAAMELGGKIDKIHEIWEFPATREFSGYVNHFWELKSKAEKGSFQRYSAKLLLNSLYGKFGSNPRNYSRAFLVELDYAAEFAAQVDGQITASIGNKRLVEAPLLDEQVRYYDVVTGLSITGCVRAKLMKAIHQNDTIYCDTDCVHIRGKFTGEVGNALGTWESEFHAKEAVYCGPKSYALKDEFGLTKFAAKGIALPKEQEFQILKQIAEGLEFPSVKDAPTFSLKRGASFITRNIVATGKQRARVK